MKHLPMNSCGCWCYTMFITFCNNSYVYYILRNAIMQILFAIFTKKIITNRKNLVIMGIEVNRKMDVGKKIKELRKRRGLTTTELAKRINLAQSTISLYENGKREPDFETIQKIANVLGVQPVIFFGDFNDNEESLDLETLLRSKQLTWGNEVLNEEEKERAIEILKLLLQRKDT